MATINSIGTAKVHSIKPVRPHEFRIGNGRRKNRVLRSNPGLVLPQTAKIEGCAEYEIDCSWTSSTLYRPTRTSHWGVPIDRLQSQLDRQLAEVDMDADDLDSKDISKVHTMVFFGSCEGLNRPSSSKAILTPGANEAYFTLTWTDLFGYPVKENQMGRKDGKGEWVLYVRKANDEELAEINEILCNIGVQV